MNKLVALLLGLVITITLVACGRTGTSSESPSVPETNSTTQSPSQEDLIAETTSAEENRVNEDSSEILVRLTFDGGEAIVLLKDNAAARNFATQLPLTQTFEDFNSIEKICRLSEEITTEGVEKGVDPEVADITLYLPWNTLVFYYEDYGYNDDLVPIGHVESGIELLADMGDEFEVTMELMEGNNTSTLVVYFSMPETTDPNNMTAEEENSTADYFNATIQKLIWKCRLSRYGFSSSPHGKNFDGSLYYVFNYAAGGLSSGGGGGFAYFLAVQITMAIAQIINFFLQRKVTFKSDANIARAAFWYVIAYIIISIGAAALQGLYKAPIYNLFINTQGMGMVGETVADAITMLINCVISFWVFFPIFKIIFRQEKST